MAQKGASQSKRLLFLCLYPEHTAPSQRFRFEQFIPYLQEAGYATEQDAFYDEATYNILYQRGHALRKAWGVVRGFARRMWRFPGFLKADYIFIQRGAAPVGPPVFEWLLARVFKKKLIYDFDDAIWVGQNKESFLKRLVSYRKKVGLICSWAFHTVAGNSFLAEYARQFSRQVSVIPTVVDTTSRFSCQKIHHPGKAVLGWTGSSSTNRYLEAMDPILCDLEKRGLNFLFISSNPPQLGIKNAEFRKWNEDTEIMDLLEMDMGWMPLPDNPWTRGKCGFKAIQYMAIGIPALVSDVGVNSEIVDDGVNGYICRSAADWVEKSTRLAEDYELRAAMGKVAKQKIEEHYSIASALPKILDLLNP